MFKKLMLLGLLALWFGLTFTSIASEVNASSHKWFKFEVTVPTDFVFDKNVVIELTNQATKETLVAYAKKEDAYIAYLNVPEGAYAVSSISIPGNYEGYFTYGYPTDTFQITKDSGDMTIVPILLELQYYGEEDMASSADNLYEGMTYDEVMREIEDEKSSAEETIDTIVSDLTEETDSNYYDTKEEPKKSLDEKVNEIKAAHDEAIKKEESKKATHESLWGGLVVMCIVLIGSGITFYYFKKKRDL